MSRFPLFFLTLAFACVLTVSCEKEDFRPQAEPRQAAPSIATMAKQSPNLQTTDAEGRAAEVMARLRAEPQVTSTTARLTVTTEMPAEKGMRYLDIWPEAGTDVTSQAQEVAQLTVDCPYGDCETRIPALIERQQEIANTQCNDQWLCITCCVDGEALYVVVYIEAICLPARFR